MKSEDLQLINKEFNYWKRTNMKQAVITKTLIDNLLGEYNKCSYTELYYDSTPDISYEEWQRLQETEEGRLKYEEMVKEYDYERKEFNNWCDPFEEGIWEFTNERIREMVKELLRELKKSTYKEPRFYIGKTDRGIELYYYSRDTEEQMDYWFHFWN